MYDCLDWSAWYNRMPRSDDPNLYVRGVCALPSSSIDLRLEPGNEGVVDEPGVFVLRLVADVPDVGDDRFVPDREVTWCGDAGPDVQTVRIQGEAQAEIEVVDAV